MQKRAPNRVLVHVLVLVCGGWTCACTPDLTPASEVVRPRILSGRIEVEGDPARATPRPGETALLRLQVAFPKQPPTADPLLDLGAVFCVATTLPDGTPYCLTELPEDLLMPELLETGPDELALRFQVPELDPQQFEELLSRLESQDIYLNQSDFPDVALFGSLCVQGKAVRNRGTEDINAVPLTEVFACERSGDVPYPYVISFIRTLVRFEFDNQNPSMACDTSVPNACEGAPEDDERVLADIALVRPEKDDGTRDIVAWPEPPADLAERSFTGCKSDADFDGLRYTLGDDPYEIRVRLDALDREALPPDPDRPDDAAEVEEPRMYLALTEGGGSLDATLRLVSADTPDDAMQVRYDLDPPGDREDLPAGLPDDGRIIRFYFSLLDGRGGVDFTSRALCLLPD